MKISKKSLFLIVSSIGLLGVTGGVLAGWAVTDEAGPTSFKVTVGALPEHTITYNIPTGSGSAYTSHSLNVTEGSNLYDSLATYHPNVGSYEFESWNESKDHFKNDDASNDKISSSFEVNDDITVWGKYVYKNVACYNVSTNYTYFTSSQNDIDINGPTSISYGNRIYGVDGVEGTTVSLISGLSNYDGRGIYKLTKNTSDWTIQRKIYIGLAGGGSDGTPSKWWPDVKTHVNLLTANDSESDWALNLSFGVDHKAYFYADVKFAKFIVIRTNQSTGTYTGAYNQTMDFYLDTTAHGSYKYTESSPVAWIQQYQDGGKQAIEWGS